MQDSQILSKFESVNLENFNSSINLVCGLLLEVFSGLGFCRSWSLGKLEHSSISDILESLYISVGSYFLPRLPILFSSFKARIIPTLLVCPNLQYQMRIFLMRLIRCVGLLYPIVIMT